MFLEEDGNSLGMNGDTGDSQASQHCKNSQNRVGEIFQYTGHIDTFVEGEVFYRKDGKYFPVKDEEEFYSLQHGENPKVLFKKG